MKINPGNARGLLVPQGDRPFSFVVYSSEIRDFGMYLEAALLLNERSYDDEWKARIAEYFECRWPEYGGERVNQALIDRWTDWLARSQ